ncbi:cilia- and flagella-associated protein 300-like [Hylaeus volcanicus]|uniref:cilia- and flagella-associated protein 300-like n=1 Tax=Hylaeus volcanicus TaxID=313075 RepID=UPI0023B86AE2|nr:cilia- and flagella-associated protein 300-like [Hylaeus volcanicus]
MEIEPKYTFVPLAQKNYVGIYKKTTQELLSKWGINGNFVIQHFSFNEPFQQYYKYHLAEAFFKDSSVAKELLTKQGKCWAKQGIMATCIEVKPVPCSILSMNFFDKIKDPKNGIVHKSGAICKRYDMEVNGFLVSDNLRGMLLDNECPEYNLYLKDERNEFIFYIFQMLVLGGAICQYEDSLDPYLNITKAIYKDLIRVQRQKDSNLLISTLVLQVIAKDSRGQEYFPHDPSHIQNVGFLLVDGTTREITTFLHQFGEYCLSQ